MSALGKLVEKALVGATREFTKAKRKAAARDRDRLTEADYRWLVNQKKREEKELIKTAAYKVMQPAYEKASGNGTLPANARQIMYAARPMVLELTNGKIWKNSAYFTQTLLPDYQEEYPEKTADWDIVYDARGHLTEPHMQKSLGLGTLEVRSYVESWEESIGEVEFALINKSEDTVGPANRYKFALFIEKEGFDHLLKRSQIPERYDLAIFSSKGMSVIAARALVDNFTRAGVTVLILHDFDLPGLTIAHTLAHDSDRYTFSQEPDVIDLGLRLKDVKAMNLQSEPVEYKQEKDPRDKFIDQDYDVDMEELNFLVEERQYWKLWRGKRVELNAMTSPQLIGWLEKKLKAAGVTKFIPDRETLTRAWYNAIKRARIQQACDEALEAMGDDIEPPVNLKSLIEKRLKRKPTEAWDHALAQIAKEMNF